MVFRTSYLEGLAISILIINRFSKHRKDYSEWFRESNEDLLFLNDDSTSEEFYKDAAYLKSFSDYGKNSMLEWEAIHLYETEKYNTVIALEEGDIVRAGRLRSYLGIRGQSLESAIAFRNKVEMKKILQKNNIHVAPFRKINSAIDLYDFIKTHGYPVVIKPELGFDSKNTFILRNSKEVAVWLDLNDSYSDLMVESFITGKMYHVDGIYENGKIVFGCVFSYIDTCLSYLESKGIGHALLETDHPLRSIMLKQTEKILKSMPTPEVMSFHAEFFYTPNEELVLCEIASRTGGGSVQNLLKYAFKIDLDEYVSRAQLGLTKDFHLPLQENDSSIGNYFVPPKEGTLVSYPLDLPFPWVFRYGRKGEPGTCYKDINKSSQNYAVVYVIGKNETEVRERINTAVSYIEKNTEWK